MVSDGFRVLRFKDTGAGGVAWLLDRRGGEGGSGRWWGGGGKGGEGFAIKKRVFGALSVPLRVPSFFQVSLT